VNAPLSPPPFLLALLFTQETTMEIKNVILIMFVVFCLFVLANWLNRPCK